MTTEVGDGGGSGGEVGLQRVTTAVPEGSNIGFSCVSQAAAVWVKEGEEGQDQNLLILFSQNLERTAVNA